MEPVVPLAAAVLPVEDVADVLVDVLVAVLVEVLVLVLVLVDVPVPAEETRFVLRYSDVSASVRGRK